MLQLEPIDPQWLGQRLADARKARGATQEEAAALLGCSRPTFIAIEKGTRPVKAEEIAKLASYYGRSVHDLVRPGQPLTDFQPHLRAVAERLKTEDGELLRAIEELQRFAEDYRELERLVRAPLRFNYPAEVTLSPRVDVTELAEDTALRERQRLGLGDQPVRRLREILESEVGIRIFYGSLPSAIAGMYAFVSDLGCCVLINRKHPPERRRASMAHEYGHVFVDRFKPGIDYLSSEGRKPANERFAEAFAMSFNMPANSVRRRFHEIVNSSSDFQVADLCRLSHFYFVSVEAMTLRLEKLGLVPKGTWDHLKRSGLKVREAAELLQLPSQPVTNEPYPQRYKYLAVRAFEQDLISEGQLARFLRCDRVAAREIVAKCLTSTEVSANGEVGTMQLDFQHSLLSPIP